MFSVCVRERGRVSMCVLERERNSDCARNCISVYMCACERVGERERERETKREMGAPKHRDFLESARR